ncbi:MAG TPA: hypothetical protein PK395_19910 [bacterium]|nr:hypothetical protein [bacterium]
MFRNLNITILLVIMTVFAVPSMGEDETQSAVPQVSGNHSTINMRAQGKDGEDLWTLWPGESYTYEGIKVTWNIDPNTTDPYLMAGTLTVQGASEMLRDIPLVTSEVANEPVAFENMAGKTKPRPRRDSFILYIDEVVFTAGYDIGTQTEPERLKVQSIGFFSKKQPANYPVTGAPFENQLLYVSCVSPIYLNPWKLSVSETPKQYPDGSEYYELIALNSVTKESFTLPLARDAIRKFGRFEITVAFFTPRTGTAQLKVNADEDYTIRGLDTYINGYSTRPPESAPFGELLENLGQKYGFTVEWIPYPGHPESIEYARNSRKCDLFELRPGIIRELLINYYLLREHYILDCQDPKVLKIQAKDYDLVIAEQEKQAREEEKKRIEEAKEEERKRIEQAEAEEKKKAEETEVAEEYKALRTRFETECALPTKAFRLSKLSAPSIKPMIESELHNYYIFPVRIMGNAADPGATLVEKGKHYSVYSYPKSSLTELYSSAFNQTHKGKKEENVIADEKSNTLIVTATKEALDKIEKIISDMENLIGESAKKGPADIYRVEMVLLQGLDGAASRIEAATATPTPAAAKIEDASAMARYGISKEDLEIFGFTSVKEMGKAVVNLLGVPDETGKAEATLSDSFSCELEFRDFMEPYLVLTGKLKDQEGKALLSNSVYLQTGKPSVLGLTNLHQAVILVLRLHGGQ